MEVFDRPEWGFRETPRVTLYESPEMEASVHWVVMDGRYMPFFHLEVFEPWSMWLFRTSKKRFAEWLAKWKQFPLFTYSDEDSEVLDRLRVHFGFEYLRDVPCSDGKIRRLFVHYGPPKGV